MRIHTLEEFSFFSFVFLSLYHSFTILCAAAFWHALSAGRTDNAFATIGSRSINPHATGQSSPKRPAGISYTRLADDPPATFGN